MNAKTHGSTDRSQWAQAGHLGALLAVCLLLGACAEAELTGAGNAQFKVDADPAAPGIQTTVSIPVDQTFRVLWNISPGDTGPYFGYQGKMAFDESVVKVISGASLGSICSSEQMCAPAGPVINNGKDPLGQGTIFAGEAIVSPAFSTSSYAGDVYEVTLQCLAAGTSPLDLRPPPPDPLGQVTSLAITAEHPTDTFDAEVKCTGAASASPVLGRSPVPATPIAATASASVAAPFQPVQSPTASAATPVSSGGSSSDRTALSIGIAIGGGILILAVLIATGLRLGRRRGR